MIETHPFSAFIPRNSSYLMLGSFVGKSVGNDPDDWFYVTKRNQFWSILESVYGVKLEGKLAKQKLFNDLSIAVTDIIYQCERKNGTNLDNNLTSIVYNLDVIKKILKENKVRKVFFSSRYVEKLFRKEFKNLIQELPELELITLPSPSPRYAAMSKDQKAKRYKELFPLLKK